MNRRVVFKRVRIISINLKPYIIFMLNMFSLLFSYILCSGRILYNLELKSCFEITSNQKIYIYTQWA